MSTSRLSACQAARLRSSFPTPQPLQQLSELEELGCQEDAQEEYLGGGDEADVVDLQGDGDGLGGCGGVGRHLLFLILEAQEYDANRGCDGEED